MQVVSNGFSGFYLSPTVGLNERYYIESRTLTVTSNDGANGIKGSREAMIFYNAQTDSATFVRQHSSITAEFFAVPMDLR